MGKFENYLAKKSNDEVRNNILNYFPKFDLDKSSDEMIRVLYMYTINEVQFEKELKEYEKKLTDLSISIQVQKQIMKSQMLTEKNRISTFSESELEKRIVDIENKKIDNENLQINSRNNELNINMKQLDSILLQNLIDVPKYSNKLSISMIDINELNDVEKSELEKLIEYEKNKESLVKNANSIFNEGLKSSKKLYKKNYPSAEENMRKEFGDFEFKLIFNSLLRSQVKEKISGSSANSTFYLGIISIIIGFLGGFITSILYYYDIEAEIIWATLMGVMVLLIFGLMGLWFLILLKKTMKAHFFNKYTSEYEQESNYAAYAYINYIQKNKIKEIVDLDNDFDSRLLEKYKLFFTDSEFLFTDYKQAFVISDYEPYVVGDIDIEKYGEFVKISCSQLRN